MTKKLQSVTDRIKTYEDACNELGLLPYPHSIAAMADDELAYYKLKVITKALNEGWKPDWANTDERKYYPYFKIANPGARCGLADSHSAYARATSYSHHGVRLAFKSRELADYAGEQFKDIYEDFLL